MLSFAIMIIMMFKMTKMMMKMHYNYIIVRLKYIMLLKLPIIILFSNSFYYSQNYSQYKASYFVRISLIYIATYVKNYNISYLNKKSKKDLWFSQLAKGILSELHCYGYECIVDLSLCKEYECKRLCFDSTLKFYVYIRT